MSEEKDLFIDNGGHLNFLIAGDNLASLKLLEKTHKGKIDLIYIDPPYNRGINDFKYDDDFIVKSDGYIPVSYTHLYFSSGGKGVRCEAGRMHPIR